MYSTLMGVQGFNIFKHFHTIRTLYRTVLSMYSSHVSSQTGFVDQFITQNTHSFSS